MAATNSKSLERERAKKRIEQLRKEIEHHRYLYHVLDTQEISDAANDSLKNELVQLEKQFSELITPDSPSQRIGGVALQKFEKIRHETRQWSLDDAFTREDALRWEERNRNLLSDDATKPAQFEYEIEPKIDGLHIALTYREGVLQSAATRGDGFIGENVTHSIRTIEAVPLRLDKQIDIFIEGEIFMHKDEFEKLNQRRAKSGEPLFANPRNASAGAIRQLDPSIAAQRKLDCVVYECSNASIPIPAKQSDKLQFLRELGCKVNPYVSVQRSLEGVCNAWQEWGTRRSQENYWIDGVVVKINDIELQRRVGYTGKSPRWALALKFAPEEATTVLKDVTYQVGRTGKITPVAVFEPVKVHGTIVQHASLHNFDEIQRLDIRIGDTVIIHKAGDIIPQVKQVLKGLRPPHAQAIKPPKKCPSCGAPVHKEDSDYVDYVCSNPRCRTIFLEELTYFVGKGGLDIKGLGTKIVEHFADVGLVTKRSDIFGLQKAELLELERFAEKSADNLVAAIERARRVTLRALIRSLGIPLVGDQTASLFVGYLERSQGAIRSIRELLRAMDSITLEGLLSVHGIGERVAQSIVAFFAHAANRKELQEFEHRGVRIIREQRHQKSQIFNNKTFVLTGSLERLSRAKAQHAITQRGGTVSSSVSAKTDYVVVGLGPGSKYDKARALGVKTLNEAQFLAMIN